MSTAKRLAVSLLVSTFLFAVFAFAAFTGVFPWIEAQFYSPRVVTELQSVIEKNRAALEDWQQDQTKKWVGLAESGIFKGVFVPTQSRDDIQKRYTTVKLFLQGFNGAASLRIVDSALEKIHFSSVDSDVLASGDFSITYKKLTNQPPGITADDLKDGKNRLLFDPVQGSFISIIPYTDSVSRFSGFLVGSVPLEDLRIWLWEKGGFASGEPLYSAGNDTVLISRAGKLDKVLQERIKSLFQSGVLPPVQKLAQAEDRPTLMLLLGTKAAKKSGTLRIGMVVPETVMTLSDVLKTIILASFFMVLFLLSFLILNLKGEPLSLVSRKVKRFQLQVLKEYLDRKEEAKVRSVKEDLSLYSDKIKKDIRKSLGPIRKKDSGWVDDYIDKSWKEILDLLGNAEDSEKPKPPQSSSGDWQRLEKMLEEILAKGTLTRVPSAVSDTPAVKVTKTPAVQPVVPVKKREEAPGNEELEELDEAEEVEELEELDEAAEAEELEELDEAAEAEELEELDEAAEAEELEELDEADSTDSATLLEELPRQSGSSDLYNYRPSALADAPLAVLEGVDEEGAPEAELEELEPADEPLIAVRLPDDQSDRTEIRSYSMDDLDGLFAAPEESVFQDQEDVVTLSDSLFQSVASTPTDELGRLLSGETRERPAIALALEDEFEPQPLVRTWKWTGGGFDWDSFSPLDGEAPHFQSLLDAAIAFDSFAAGILVENNGVWTLDSGVGFSDLGRNDLVYGPESDLSRQCLTQPGLHFMTLVNGRNRMMDASFHERDMKFLKAVILVSILYQHRKAWLILGQKKPSDDVIGLLKPREIR